MDDPRPPEEKHLSLCLWCDNSEICENWDDDKMETCVAFEARPTKGGRH